MVDLVVFCAFNVSTIHDYPGYLFAVQFFCSDKPEDAGVTETAAGNKVALPVWGEEATGTRVILTVPLLVNTDFLNAA